MKHIRSGLFIFTCITLAVTACSSSENANHTLADTLNDPGIQTSLPVETNDPTGTKDTAVAAVTTGSADVLVVDNFDLPSRAYPYLQKLGGYSLEALTKDIALVGDLAGTSAISSQRLPDTEGFTSDDRGEFHNTVIEQTRYSCSLGGEVTLGVGRYELYDSSYSRETVQREYRFDQCVIELDGVQALNGQMILFSDSKSASRAVIYERRQQWTDFSWVRANGDTTRVDASMWQHWFSSYDSFSKRTATINHYETVAGNEIIEQIVDGKFDLTDNITSGGGAQDYTLFVAGTITDSSAIGVAITTDTTFRRKQALYDPSEERIPFEGHITMDADNGARLFLQAVPLVDSTALTVDLKYTDHDGTTTINEALSFVDLVGVVF